MVPKLIKHGTEQGYREELKQGNPCNRCRNGHREFDRQYSRAYKAKGIKYKTDQVVDHLYTPGKTRGAAAQSQARPVNPSPGPPGDDRDATAGPGQPSLGQRLSDALSAAVGRSGSEPENDYVTTDDPPGYLSSVDPDPEPSDGENWGQEPETEYVLNTAGLEKIEQNLGTYLSIVGMTAEMIDPYCGPILADNFDNIVKRWTKVIAHYPKAAELFLDGKGGVIMTWIGAIQATWPVLMAIYHHHLARDIQVRNGREFRRDGAQRPVPDSTMPPMPDDFNYSAL
jgi:hypothetical protein